MMGMTIILNVSSGDGLFPDGNKAITWTNVGFSLEKFPGI